MLSDFYLVWTVYTIIWIIVWVIVISYRNKEVRLLQGEFEKLSDKYDNLKEKYDKLEGKYEERCSMLNHAPDNETEKQKHLTD